MWEGLVISMRTNPEIGYIKKKLLFRINFFSSLNCTPKRGEKLAC